MRAALAAALLFLAAGACSAPASQTRRWAGTADTSATGVVVVRNTGPGLWSADSAWRLEEELRIGAADETGPGALANPVVLEADRAGRIYVIELRPNEVRLYARDGRFLRTLMRTGSGPGEVRGASGLAWDQAGRLWVVDQGSRRFTVLGTSGARLAERRMTGLAYMLVPWQGAITPTGDMVEIALVADRAAYLRLAGARGENREAELWAAVRRDSSLRQRDTLRLPVFVGPVFRLHRRIDAAYLPVPFASDILRFVDPRGYVWWSLSERYRIVQQTMRGDTVRIVERDVRPAPVTAAEKDSVVRSLGRFVRTGGVVNRSLLPDVKPPIGDLWVDDRGYLWTRRYQVRGAPAGTLFDVFDPEGRYLGEVRAPLALQFVVIRGTALYAIATGEDDEPVIVRYRIRGR